MRVQPKIRSTAGTIVAVSLALGVLVALPYIVRGAPGEAHDFEFHVNTWMELALALKQTHVYPQWAEGANFGAGEPRFIFYPPVSLLIGAFLTGIAPVRITPAFFVFLAASLSAASMWLLARSFTGRRWALLAAACYALSPYLLLTAYARAAYSELLLGAIVPLGFIATFRTLSGSWRWTAVLAVAYGIAWMTNLPGTLLLSYALVLFAVVLAYTMRSGKSLLLVVAGIALGFGIAATFLIPMLQQRRFVQSASVIECHTCVQDNFLFTDARAGEPVHQRFNAELSYSFAAQFAICAGSMIFLARKRSSVDRRLIAFAVVAVVSAFMMFRPALAFWDILPQLRYAQFPWRFGFIFTCALVLLIVSAMQQLGRTARTALASGSLITAIAAAWLWIPSWKPADFTELTAKFRDGYWGVQEYAPKAAPSVHGAMRGLPPIDMEACGDTLRSQQTQGGRQFTCGVTTALLEKWNARERALHVETLEPTSVTILQYLYPTWEVRVNGRRADVPAPTEEMPYIRVEVPAGVTSIQIVDVTTETKKLARVVSAVSLLLAVIMFARGRRREPVGSEPEAHAVQAVQC